MNESQQPNKIRHSTEFDEDGSYNGGVIPSDTAIMRKEQEHMKSGAGDGGAWSPSNKNNITDPNNNNRNSIGKVPVSYYTQNSAVDGIIGKLGHLEAMILA